MQRAPGRTFVPCWLALAVALFIATGVGATSDPEIRPWTDRAAPIAPHLTPDAWTLVMFWSVTCGICAAETPKLNAFYQQEQQRDRGVSLLGVSIDGPAMHPQVAGWMQDHGMGFPTLLGDLASIASYFSAATQEAFRGTPTFMIFNPRGQLVGVNAGPIRVQAVKDFIARKEKID